MGDTPGKGVRQRRVLCGSCGETAAGEMRHRTEHIKEEPFSVRGYGKGARGELKMSKVLIVTNHSYMLYRFRKELVQRLAAEHDVVISTPFVGHEEDLEQLGARCICTDVDRRGMNPLKDLKLMQHYREILHVEQPDFVVTYSIKPNIYMGMICRMMGVPYYANVQGLGSAFENKKLAAIVTPLYRMALKKASRVFFENAANAREFLDLRVVSKNKITVLPGAGINLDEYSYQPYPAAAPLRFLYLGRIMKEKGMDEWFYAIRRLKKEYGEAVAFDMVGFFEDEYKERVEKLQAEGVIEFYGFQSEPRPYYAKAGCVVLPSYHEGLSNVLLEAAAMGRPVVTSDVAGCREAVVDGQTGYLCPAKSGEALYNSMKRMLELSADMREEMGRKGCQFVKDNFAKERVVEKTVCTLAQ